MKCVRVIPKHLIGEVRLNNLEQFGFTLVDKEDVIELWTEVES